MNKKFFALLALVCILAICLDILISYTFMTHLFKVVDIRKQELNKIYQYEQFLSQLKDAEYSQLRYLITGDPAQLLFYQSALDYFNSQDTQNFLAEEEKNANPKIVEKAKAIQELTQDKFHELQDVIDVRKNMGFEEARKALLKYLDKKTLRQVRAIIASIEEEREDYLASLEKNIKRASQNNFLQLIISDIIAALLLTACLLSLHKYIRKLAQKDKELSHALSKLHESSAMQKAILNSTNYAIISVDTQGIITSFNPAAEKMLGYTSQEVVGKVTPAIFHDKKEMEERSLALFKQLQAKISANFEVFIALAKQDIPDTNEWTYIRKDGTRFPIQLTVTAIKDDKDQVVGFVGFIHDLTERKELDRIKDEIFNLTNYELRESITTIKGALQIIALNANLLPDRTQRILDMAKQNCLYLVNLTNDILEIQKIEMGRVSFNYKEFDLSLFLSHAIEINSSSAKQAHVSLVCPIDIPHWMIKGDEERLTQVMNRLLATMIMYSSSGETIEITAYKMNSKIRVEISNPSSGIPQELHSKIFQKFAQDAAVFSHKKENSLGLNIAKTIIEKHGGTIGIQTYQGKGTTLWFELPNNP